VVLKYMREIECTPWPICTLCGFVCNLCGSCGGDDCEFCVSLVHVRASWKRG
jgi:hypothetical protein